MGQCCLFVEANQVLQTIKQMIMEKQLLQIINYIRSNKELEPLHQILPNDNLRNDLGFTSFDLAELTVRIEDELGIDIFENGIVSTVGEVIDKLRK